MTYRRSILTGTIAALASFTGLGIASKSAAATFVYTPANSIDLWSTGTNWDLIPASAADTRLTFVGANATVLADGLANVNTNDLTGPFSLNILDLQGTGSAATPTSIVIESGPLSTGLNFVSNGATTPMVNLNALVGAGLAYSVNPAITLSSNTTFAGAGTATFNFNGGLSGAAVNLTKSGVSSLRLGGATTVASVAIGSNNAGGSIVGLAGSTFSIGSGLAGQTLSIGAAGATASSGTFDASATASFTANVATIVVGSAGGGGVGGGVLNLGGSNALTAFTSFVIGNSNTTFNNSLSTVTTAPGGFTSVRTPSMTIGGNKSRGEFILGAGSTLDLAGLAGGRAALVVGNTTTGGGSGSWTGTANFTDGIFRGNLSTLLIGNRTVLSSSATDTGTMTLSNDPGNHLDMNGTSATFGGVVTIGRATAGTTSGAAVGTLTIGNLDFTSQIVSSNNGTGILLGVNGAAPVTGTGTLNLNGGTLGITTTGSAIAGSNGTSIVKFNGTTLRAGASSASWITGLTNANVSDGGIRIDSNGFSITVPQNLVHDAAGAATDGGLTKSGNGTLTLTGTNTYTGTTTVNGGLLHLTKTDALPNFAAPGALSVAGGATLGVNIGGAGEFSVAQLETLRTNGSFVGAAHNLAISTANAGGDVVYASSLGTIGNFAKLGANKLTLANNPAILGGLSVGADNDGGTLAAGSATPFSVGSGPADNVLIGGSLTPSNNNYNGTLDVSVATQFNANVGNFFVGNTGGGNPVNTSFGSLILTAENSITAAGEFRVGRSENQPMSTGGTVTTPAASATSISTPLLTVATGKSSGNITTGAGSTLALAGVGEGNRAALIVGSATIGTGSALAGTLDASGGVLNATLGNVIIGDHNHTSGGSITGSLLLSNNASNHFDLSAAGNAVTIGRKQSASGGTANGTFTIGNLDATSSITSTDNATGILVGSGTLSNGTLNLNGGTLTITTTGRAIGGGTGTSTVNFNGTTIRAGASSADWISGLTTANVSTGGAKFDTNGNDAVIPQSLIHDAGLGGADGGLTKSGAGVLTLGGTNTYTGPTAIAGGTLLVNGSLSGASAVAVDTGGTLGGTDGTVGSVLISSGGTIAPGASIGTLNSGPVTCAGGTFALEIDTNNVMGLVGSSDRLAITGGLTLGTGSNLTLSDLGGNVALADDTKFTFITYTGGWDNNPFNLGGNPLLDGTDFTAGANIYRIDYDDGGNSVSLTVVPEPGGIASLIGGAGLLLGFRRRDRR